MKITIDPFSYSGLSKKEQEDLAYLLKVYRDHEQRNAVKEKYYEGNISVNEVNLGIALPDGMQRLEIGCSWGAKCVDVLAARSMFDGFVGMNGEDIEELNNIVEANNLIVEYSKATRDELKLGSTFATLSADDIAGCKIRFHSLMTASAKWNGARNGIECGFAVIEAAEEVIGSEKFTTASILNFYTDTDVIVFQRDGNVWSFKRYPHKMGRPLMEPMTWNATSGKPFGRSRIKEPVRRLIQGYVRTLANASIGLEFATAPQKYILGVSDEQYEKLSNSKFKQYVGNILAATTDPSTGEKPTYGQLTQGNIQPHVDMLRMLATQFSAATGLTVTDTGVVNDANPTSSDAILAQSQTLVGMAEQLNAGNGNSLKTIAVMALAIAQNKTPEELTPAELEIMAHFKNPAMPSVAVTADAAIKIASSRQSFAQTDTFLEMIGFSKADIRRIRAQEQRSRGAATLEAMGIE